ncbi:peptide ABC transporter substrate-binding protein [Gemmobacter serpentinus]|uniref:peptide ABC transporter substrate-binding protein n=1 Tax=Gemmobacter serpentinus TaxID=2652247 RepID=UPI00124BE46F|nr:peptide ABC transporter substrate-binding protein [Gemmobacter serpentinus]
MSAKSILPMLLRGTAAALILAPTAFVPAAHAARGSDGELRLLFNQAVSTLNVYLSSGTKDITAASLVLEPLAAYDPDGQLVPRLAAEIPSQKNGGIATDLTSITWKLKPGVQWSDGTPLTSEDVKFTYDYCRNPETGCAHAAKLDGVIAVETPDPQTVTFRFAAPMPYPFQPFTGATGPVLQKAQFAACLGKLAATCTAQNASPIGTGPFMVTDFKVNDVVTMAANPLYREAEKPAFATATIKGGGDALSSASAVLETGEFDYAWNTLINPEQQLQMEAGGKGRFVSAFGALVERIEVNLTDPAATLPEGERSTVKHPHPILSDVRVRKALSLAIARDVLVEIGYGAAGKPTCNMVAGPPHYVSDNTACLHQDLPAARALLEAAGWQDTDGDGIREKDGRKLSFLFQTTVNPVRQDFQALIKGWWNDIGVEVDLKAIDGSVFFSGDAGSPDTNEKFYADFEMYANEFDGTDPQAYLAARSCDKIPAPDRQWQGENIGRFCDPAYDAMVAELAKTANMAERAQLVKALNDRLTAGDQVVIPLIHRGRFSAISNTLGGVALSAWDSELWNVADWHRLPR